MAAAAALRELADDELIDQLGDQKYKVRKAAKEEIISLGSKVRYFLLKHKKHPDFEVQVSINEIIKELKPTRTLPVRVKVSR